MLKRSLCAAAALLFFTAPMNSTIAAPLDTLKPEHPRLLVNANTWTDMQRQRREDALLDGMLRKLEVDATAILEQPPAERVMEGRRLLHTSRKVLRRVLLLGVQYKLSGDERFARRATQEMLAAAAFTDWNPSHFLDVAEMTAALGIGYDWLYAQLTLAERATIRTAIVEKGLRLGNNPKHGWLTNPNNWNQVCLGGMALGALAVAEEEPELANQILALVRGYNHNGLRPYQPDGIYPEGPMYWSYGTTYQVILLDALNSALGTDWGLSQSQGFLPSAAGFLQMTGPTERFFNFSDSHEKGEVEPAVFWFAKRLQQPELLEFQKRALARFNARPGETPNSEVARFFPLTALWWTGKLPAKPDSLPLAWHGDGPNPIAVFRTSWTDPNAMYLGVKAGSASVSHGHMDAGSFVFESDGVRWAKDLGLQNYNSLETKGVGLWDGKQDGERWKIYRWNNFVHNTLTINNQLHRVNGRATIAKFSADAKGQSAVLDLTKVFGSQVSKATRKFTFNPNHSIVVSDELEGLKPNDEVRWAMVTEAQVTIQGREAILELEGKKLHLQVQTPENVTLEVIPADPPQNGFDAPNPNTRIIRVKTLAPESGKVEMVVELKRPTQ